MKTKFLLLTAALALLGISGAMADDAIAAKRFNFPLSSANTTWGGDKVTVNVNSFTFNAGTKEDGSDEYGNAAMGWTTITDISEYTNLVLELEEATTSTVEICVCNGGFWGMANNYTTTLPQGDTKISIPITNMKKNYVDTNNSSNSGDGSALNLAAIDLIFLRTGWVHEQTVKIKEFYLEQTTDVAVNDTKEIEVTNPTETSYKLDGETNYKYLVIVPSAPYVEKGAQFLYNLSDGTNNIQDWGFAYGNYQQRRATFLNLTDKKVYQNDEETEQDANGESTVCKDFSSSNIDMTKLAKLSIIPETEGTELEISAIYFTNDKPTYSNQWNFPVSKCDYVRETTTTGTWGTVCLPYNAAICGAYTYEVAGVDNKENPTKLYLRQVYGLLKAGVSYIFKTNTNRQGDFEEGYVTFYRAGASSVAKPTNKNVMVGSFNNEKQAIPDGCYYLKDGLLKKCVSGKTNYVGQYKAYFDFSKAEVISDVNAAKANCISFDVEGNSVTSINNAKAEQKNSDAIYNLNGTRVMNPTKGIYIKNGKKFVVK